MLNKNNLKMVKINYDVLDNDDFPQDQSQKSLDYGIQSSYKKIIENINTESKNYELLYNAFSKYRFLNKTSLRIKKKSGNKKKIDNKTSSNLFNKRKHSKLICLSTLNLKKKIDNEDNNIKIRNNTNSLKLIKNSLTARQNIFRNSRFKNNTYSKPFLQTNSFPIRTEPIDFLNVKNENNNKNLYGNDYNYKQNKSRNNKLVLLKNNTENKKTKENFSEKILIPSKKRVNIFEYYNNNTLHKRNLSEKNENLGEYKLVYDIKKINDRNEKIQKIIEKSKFKNEIKDRRLLKRINKCKKKIMSVNQNTAINEKIKKLIKTKNNKKIVNYNEEKNINNNKFIKITQNYFNMLNKVKERKLKEKIFIDKAEDIMLKSINLVYDVNKIDKRLNYKKFLYDNPV